MTYTCAHGVQNAGAHGDDVRGSPHRPLHRGGGMGLSPANHRPAAGTVLVGEPLETASIAVVVVHGRDQDPHWMLDNFVRPLDLPHVAFILPAAQEGSWYPNRFFDPAEDNEPCV